MQHRILVEYDYDWLLLIESSRADLALLLIGFGNCHPDGLERARDDLFGSEGATVSALITQRP